MPQPPTSELGSLTDLQNSLLGSAMGGGFGSWSHFAGDMLEHVPELQYPQNVRTYHTMRNDSQVQGLFLGSTLPIRRYSWYLEPNGANPSVVEKLSSDYNIPIRGQEDQPMGRRKRRFALDDHLRHALLAVMYGHMFFEQVGDIQDDGLWHMRKLGPRMPHTIEEILIDRRDGGLSGIRQRGMGVTRYGNMRRIPVDRLVAYVWEQEGGNFAGRSMLRGIFKNWLLKDTVLRVGAINIERAGGVPVITGPKGASPDDLAELAKMARQFRIGEGSGGAIPNGAELNLARAAGGDEAVNFIKLMNEEMGRGWLMMFMNLGQSTTGSYALGSSLIDYVLNTQETIANWFCDVFNEHVIEDDVDWNYGENEQAPILGFRRMDDKQVALNDFANLINSGLITVDDELEGWIREEYKMPRRDPNSTPRFPPANPASQVIMDPATQGDLSEEVSVQAAAGLADSPVSSSSAVDNSLIFDHINKRVTHA